MASHTAGTAGGDPAVISVRALAVELGVAPNTAQRALRLLRDRGLIHPRQGRATGGRFEHGAYHVDTPPGIFEVAPPGPSAMSVGPAAASAPKAPSEQAAVVQL